MRRWLKRIAIVAAVLVVAVLATAAVVAWRATRVPDWYAKAVEALPVDSDAVINDRILPLQNWLARTSAGDLAEKSDAEKTHTLDLTEEQINALIATYRDNVHGPLEAYRVRLRPDRIDVACTWVDPGRCVAAGIDVGHAGGRPTVALGDVRLGNQAVPAVFFRSAAVAQVRGQLDATRKRDAPPKIDDNDNAPARTVGRYYGRLLLDVLAGRAVSPEAFLPKQLSSNDWVATRVDALDVTDGRLKITFRFLTPAEIKLYHQYTLLIDMIRRWIHPHIGSL